MRSSFCGLSFDVLRLEEFNACMTTIFLPEDDDGARHVDTGAGSFFATFVRPEDRSGDLGGVVANEIETIGGCKYHLYDREMLQSILGAGSSFSREQIRALAHNPEIDTLFTQGDVVFCYLLGEVDYRESHYADGEPILERDHAERVRHEDGSYTFPDFTVGYCFDDDDTLLEFLKDGRIRKISNPDTIEEICQELEEFSVAKFDDRRDIEDRLEIDLTASGERKYYKKDGIIPFM